MAKEKTDCKKAETENQVEKPKSWLRETASALTTISYNITGNADAIEFMLEDLRDEFDLAKTAIPQLFCQRYRDEIETIIFLLGALKGETAKLEDKVGEIEKKSWAEE